MSKISKVAVREDNCLPSGYSRRRNAPSASCRFRSLRAATRESRRDAARLPLYSGAISDDWDCNPPYKGVSVMVAHRYFSNRVLLAAALTAVLAATLPSCGGGSAGPPASNRAIDTPPPASPPPHRELTWSGKVDTSLWSSGRVKAYKAALREETPPPLAILRIPRLELEVPVYDGTTDAVLDLAAGLIEGTVLPGTAGNVGIAAHRDGFFRVLKDLKEGDALVLDTPVATEQYRVSGSGSPRRTTSA